MSISLSSHFHQLPSKFYEEADPTPVKDPALLAYNSSLAKSLGLSLTKAEALSVFSGNQIPEGLNPLAMAYAGHQFGVFVPVLGDGRAILLGEAADSGGRVYDIQLKGAGLTPFSRRGDGRAPLGAVIREYLVSEAMHHLGIATTRCLAAVATCETVMRRSVEPGGVVTRVAASHIRVGTFEYFAAKADVEAIQTLLNFSIARHFPELKREPNTALSFFNKVIELQADLVADWMRVGFIHGVMNTDNMAISGETIDYGPCAFMNVYDPETVFSSIDTVGRYMYGNQPKIAHWNLSRLGECLIPLLDDDSNKAFEIAKEALTRYPEIYRKRWYEKMLAKMGVKYQGTEHETLLQDFLALLLEHKKDFTNTFRSLSTHVTENREEFQSAFNNDSSAGEWFDTWQTHIEDVPAAIEMMNAVNPVYIPRNHLVEEVIAEVAFESDTTKFNALLETLKTPYRQQDKPEFSATPEPEPGYRTFCGT